MLNNWKKTNEGREYQRARLLDAARKASEKVEALRAQAGQLAPLEPPARLVECGAYLYTCAMESGVPSFHDAAVRGFRVHAAALASVLKDALDEGMVTWGPEGRLYATPEAEPLRALWLLRNRK